MKHIQIKRIQQEIKRMYYKHVQVKSKRHIQIKRKQVKKEEAYSNVT